jgi:hypothetical protein
MLSDSSPRFLASRLWLHLYEENRTSLLLSGDQGLVLNRSLSLCFLPDSKLVDGGRPEVSNRKDDGE